jgi:hypothetical protein
VILRSSLDSKFPTTITGSTTSIDTVGNYYVFTFNDSGTIGWS